VQRDWHGFLLQLLTLHRLPHLPAAALCLSGPAGKVLLLPEDPNAVLICVATGTGIAPFRSFWRRCFFENVPGYKFTGLFWLFMGAANSDGKLYDDELQQILATQPENFRVDYALSRESNSEWRDLAVLL
jgi:ferredoxin--NADP+ reductase